MAYAIGASALIQTVSFQNANVRIRKINPFLDKVKTVLQFDRGRVGSQLNAWYVKLHQGLP